MNLFIYLFNIFFLVNFYLCWSDCWFTGIDAIASKCYLITTAIFTSQWRGIFKTWNQPTDLFEMTVPSQDHCGIRWCNTYFAGFMLDLTWLWIGLVFGYFVATIVVICCTTYQCLIAVFIKPKQEVVRSCQKPKDFTFVSKEETVTDHVTSLCLLFNLVVALSR